MTIDRSFYRKLLRSYWGVRHMPYHIQETLFLLSMNQSSGHSAQAPNDASSSSHAPPALSKAAGTTATTSSLMFGVDRRCNPVDPSCNMAIDAEATFHQGLNEIRRVLRNGTVTADPNVPRGVLEYKKLVEHGKLFWLLKRFTSMKQSPLRVPSAGAGGVRTTALLERPASDTFTMVDRFLGEGNSAGSIPNATTSETSRAIFTIEATQYESKFTPVEPGGGDSSAAADDESVQNMTQVTPNRFLLTLTITPKNAAFHHALVVNSQLFCVDVPSQVLFEEVGTFVHVGRLPLLARSEELRQQAERSESGAASLNTHQSDETDHHNAKTAAAVAWFARSSSASLAKKGGARTVGGDSADKIASNVNVSKARSETYSTTIQLISDNGPGLVKGVLYVKEIIEHADASEERLIPIAAQTAIVAVPFGPIALRCTL
ncbi:GPI-anchored surface protein, putative [Bodo saltans]|uniref:GPI-anchored surface protein, putative n=1 Tax=Bodo saltans TaxID=75058 RepID=A0A0S4JBV0_BODSA|nr:GPI-anchored surface protein, putative [Bodo saltans]|eukprot:CUG88986.1 GPI-anchored surface protein, putative [Bodo saltans]